MNNYDNNQLNVNRKPMKGRMGTFVYYANLCGGFALISLFAMTISPVTVILADAGIMFSFMAKNDPSFGRHATFGLITGIIALVLVVLEYMLLIRINLTLQDPAAATEFYQLIKQFGITQLP